MRTLSLQELRDQLAARRYYVKDCTPTDSEAALMTGNLACHNFSSLDDPSIIVVNFALGDHLDVRPTDTIQIDDDNDVITIVRPARDPAERPVYEDERDWVRDITFTLSPC